MKRQNQEGRLVIIAILAAMLLPALNMARMKAKNIRCINNLKQLYLTVSMYCGDYKVERIPGSKTACVAQYYPSTLVDGGYIKGVSTGYSATDGITLTTIPKMLICPAEERNLTSWGFWYGSTYGLNTYVTSNSTTAIETGANERLFNPEKTMYFMDKERGNYTAIGTLAAVQTKRHYPTVNILFLIGNVRAVSSSRVPHLGNISDAGKYYFWRAGEAPYKENPF